MNGRGYAGAKWCGTEDLKQDLDAADLEMLKRLLWNWARMQSENGKWRDPFITKQLMQPMINVMQKGMDGRLYQ